MELINKELYDQGDNEIRNIPEERAMRYTAVCTSMLLDQVDDLGGFQMDIGPRVHNLEQVTSSLMGCQDKLNNKVNVLSFNWNLNLKYQVGPGPVRTPPRLDCVDGRNSQVFKDQGVSFFK